ncbi:MAG: rhodanese-like domain-containing protein [Bacteroidales bacterium]|nr:rhodanese-like domain-containing protein [Bacteroidales bacterium]
MKALIHIMLAALLHTGCAGRYTSVDAKQFAEAISDPQMQIVDARTPQEFREGHIPGAVNIDINNKEFIRHAGSLDKTRPVAVYCRSGRRSKIAAEKLVANGFHVTELDGGIITWEGEIIK